MTFAWPLALLTVLGAPALLAAYLLRLRRRRREAVRFSNVALVRAAMAPRASWKRHLPVGLLLGAMVALGVGAARPQASVTVPLDRTSVILALDVSRSMCATDVEPNRLTVAQDAARRFVRDQASGTRIGIVAFSGFAELIVPPTTDRDKLTSAIDGLTTSRGTAIGAATLKAIDAIAETNPDVKPTEPVEASAAGAPGGAAAGADGTDAPVTAATGPFASDIVVLLTDGANTRGVAPLVAAQQAVDRKVRVYTIGFGTQNPASVVCTREQLGGDGIGGDGGGGGFGGGPPPGAGGGGGTGGRRNFLVTDEPTLTKVAEMTGGTFHRAEDAGQLRDVFSNLPRQVVLQTKQREVTVVFAIVGALLATAAVALSMRWNR